MHAHLLRMLSEDIDFVDTYNTVACSLWIYGMATETQSMRPASKLRL